MEIGILEMGITVMIITVMGGIISSMKTENRNKARGEAQEKIEFFTKQHERIYRKIARKGETPKRLQNLKEAAAAVHYWREEYRR